MLCKQAVEMVLEIRICIYEVLLWLFCSKDIHPSREFTLLIRSPYIV